MERDRDVFNKHNLCYRNLGRKLFCKTDIFINTYALFKSMTLKILILVMYTQERNVNAELKLKKSQVK
jgi:hypothetical protein